MLAWIRDRHEMGLAFATDPMFPRPSPLEWVALYLRGLLS